MPPKPPVRIPNPPKAPKTQFSKPPPSRVPKPQPTANPPLNPPKSASKSPPPSSQFNTRAIKSGASIAFFSFCAAVLFRDHFLTIDTVNGSSMAPTLSPHAHETGEKDKILIQRGIWGRRSIQRGDVITLWKPHKRNEISIKRVIGVEGDVIYPRRGYACEAEVVRSRRVEGWDGLGTKDWVLGGEGGDGDVEVGKVVVPRGHVWVEGDNWRRSFDSCDFGPVSLGLVDGKARWVWRDWLRLQRVGDEREEKGERSRVVEGQGRVQSALDAYLDE